MVLYEVTPRYTAGSPAVVSRAIAEEVARTEREFYHHAKEGYWGCEWRRKAERLGLAGIVKSYLQRGHIYIVNDLLTGTRYTQSTN